MPGVLFMPMVGGGSVITRTFLDHAHSTASASSHTFVGLSFGSSPSAGRVIIACLEINASSFSSVTIGGIAASSLAGPLNAANGSIGIFGAVVPTGTTGNVVVNAGANATRWGVQVYELSGMTALASSDSGTSSAGAPTKTLNVPVGGVAIGCSYESTGSSTDCNWTGVTEDATDTDTLTVYSSGSIEVPSGNAALALTATFNGSPSVTRGAFASFGP